MDLQTFSLAIRNGVAVATFDAPGASMNTITAQALFDLVAITDEVRANSDIRGLVIASGKRNGFCAGADLAELENSMGEWRKASTQDDLRRGVEAAGNYSSVIRSVETCGKPVATVVHGVCLGGGLELALAGHLRISAGDRDRLRLGLPEATIGLMPGAGGTQRLPRLMGISAAMPLLLDGGLIDASSAIEQGVLHAHLDDHETAIGHACEWVLANSASSQPWDVKGYRVENGPHSARGYATLPFLIAAVRGDGSRAHVARANILRAVYEGSQVGIDAALRIEARYFFNTARSPHAAAMVRTLFHQRQTVARSGAVVLETFGAHLSRAWVEAAERLVAGGYEPAVVLGVARSLSPRLSEALSMTPGSRAHYELADAARLDDIRRALLRHTAVSAKKAIDLGMIANEAEADVFGIEAGFPASTGGPVTYLVMEDA